MEESVSISLWANKTISLLLNLPSVCLDLEKKIFFLFCQQPWRYIQAINDSKILFHSAVILPVRSNLQVNGTNTSLIHSSINCGHVTISAQHFLMIILSPTLCVIITPALLVMYLPSGEMPEIIYTVSLLQLFLLG